MNHILLLGAGFGRNWGGWLAGEVFEYLIGCPEVDAEINNLLCDLLAQQPHPSQEPANLLALEDDLVAGELGDGGDGGSFQGHVPGLLQRLTQRGAGCHEEGPRRDDPTAGRVQRRPEVIV